jgi:hypothetical protein
MHPVMAIFYRNTVKITMEDIREIKQDVKEIKAQVVVTTIHLAKYNTLLEEHIKRTTLLETRMLPVETHVNRIDGALSLLVRIIAVCSAIGALVKAYYLLFK